MSDWEYVELNSVFDVQNGFSFKSAQMSADKDGDLDYEVFKMGHIEKGGGLRTDPKRSYIQINEKTKKFILNAGDIVMAMTDMKDNVVILGVPALIDKSNTYVLNQRVARLVQKENDPNDRDFLFYQLRSPVFIKTLQSKANSGVQVNLSTSAIKSSEIFLPPLPEQKAIADVLSRLDDKIDLLHRQNETLEAMAETIFRQWFVEEAEDNWEEGCLGDLVEFHYGKGLRKSDRTHHGFPVIGSSGIVDYHSEYLVEAPGIVTGRKGTLGVVNYMFYNFYPIDTTFYIKSKLEESTLYFEYFILKVVDLVNMNTDSAVPGLNRNLAHSIQVVIPPQKLITDFNAIVEPMFLKIKSNMEQMKILEDLRDTLLPKLMSGQVRVKH